LYMNGIQRASFIPCIELLKERCRAINLDSGLDYRRLVETRRIEFLGRHLTVPQSVEGIARFTFHELCSEALCAADYIELVGHYHTVFVTDIPRMSLQLRNEARRFITMLDAMYENKTTLICSAECSISELFVEESGTSGKDGEMDSAQRLLMDDLGLTAKQAGLRNPFNIFTGQEEVFAFQRAVSRLIEMQGWSMKAVGGDA
ncbi:AFG1-like ATPase-domain-containing protein, partial [Thamnocephalis sphaerospora]